MAEHHFHLHIEGLGDVVRLLTRILHHSETQETKMTVLDDKLTALQATAAKIENVEASVLAFVQGIPALIQAAVDAAVAAGAPPATLQAFDDLNTRLSADADKIAADIVTPPPAP